MHFIKRGAILTAFAMLIVAAKVTLVWVKLAVLHSLL